MKRLALSFLARRASHNDSDEAGQGLAEFGLILALIAVVCIAALTLLGQSISTSAGFVALPAAL